MVAGRPDHRWIAGICHVKGAFKLANTAGDYSDPYHRLWRVDLRAAIPAYRAQGFGRLDRRDVEDGAQSRLPAPDRMHDDHSLDRTGAGADVGIGAEEHRRDERNSDPGLWQRADVRPAIFRRTDRAQNFPHRNDVGVGDTGRPWPFSFVQRDESSVRLC